MFRKKIYFSTCLFVLVSMFDLSAAVNTARKTNSAFPQVSNNVSDNDMFEMRVNLRNKHHQLKMRTAEGVKNPSQNAEHCQAIECPSRSTVPYCSVKCKSNECSPTVKLITQKHFEGKGRDGIVLNKPGLYKLVENIAFSPKNEGTQAIAITASNVTLDLGPFTLSQANKVKNIYGIAICRDTSYVKITGVEKEAKVLDFSLVGIRVLGRTDTITIENVTVQQSVPVQMTNEELPESCSDLICFSLNAGIIVGEGDTVGLFMKGTSKENRVKNFFLHNSTVRGSVLGCQIVMTFHVEVIGCLFTENTYSGLVFGLEGFIPGDFFGIEFPLVDDAVVRDTHVDKNVGDNLNLTNADGFFSSFNDACGLNEVRGFTVENCTFNDNENSAFVVGADHDGSHDMTWKNCQFYRNRSGSFLGDGLHFSGSIPSFNAECFGFPPAPLFPDVNISVDNCVSADNGALFGQAIGFVFIFVDGACVTNCCSEGQVGGDSTAGFAVLGRSLDFGHSKGVTFDHCIATRNGNDSPIGGAAGFAVRKSSSNVVIRNCTANANGNSNDLGDFAAGIYIAPYIRPPRLGDDIFNIIVDNCIINGNGNTNNDTDSANTSGGIVVKLTPFLQGEIVNIFNILVQNTTVANNIGNGIFYDDIAGSSINNCNVFRNSKVGIDVSAVTNPNKVLVTQNYAYDNGAGNYAGVALANRVVGTTAALPASKGLLNADITP